MYEHDLTDEEREVKARLHEIAQDVLRVLTRHAERDTPRYGRYLTMRANVAAVGHQFAEAIREDPEQAPAICRAMIGHLTGFLTDVDQHLDFVLGAAPTTRHH